MLDSYRFGPFEVRAAQRLLLQGGQAVAVGARAFDVLLALIEQRGALVTKSALLDRVWPGLVVEEANVQVQVSALRKLLGADAIATIPGLGYRFAAGLQESAAPEAVDLRRSDADLPVRIAAPSLQHATNTLVGRADDVRMLAEWVASDRLVTVLGPGGIGKTRLVQEVAQRLAREWAAETPGGVAWVDLSAINSAEHLAATMANAARLPLGDVPGSAQDALVRALTERELLLVLDNCEHLVADVGRMAHAILSTAPKVRMLVTSQERLKVPGERVYRLEPLSVPPPGTPTDRLLDFSAAQMLAQRARLSDRRFEITPANGAAVAQLLSHLDGLPLAIEMAAARLPVMGPQALCERLSEWLRLLRGDSHGVPARQHTLRATLDWSHSLLSAPEQTLLRRLAVFAGSFRIDTAQRTAADGELDAFAVLDGLGSLVDKSLVQLDRLEPPRYRLLETTRLYAAEQLAQHAEFDATVARHGQAMAVLASEVEERYWTMGDTPWLASYAPEYDDLQAAFDRACAAAQAEVAALTGNALQRLDHLRSVNAPRRRRTEALFALLPAAAAQARAWIWNCLASHGLIALEVMPRLDAARNAVQAWRDLNDTLRLHFALGFYAAECARAGRFDDADRAIAEAQALENPAWPLRRLMWGAAARGGVCIHRGDAAGYRKATRTELALADQAGAERAAAWARLKLADAALMADDLAEAIELGWRAVRELRLLDQPSNLGLALSNLCAALLLNGHRSAAAQAAAEALPLMWRNGWGYLLLDSVALLAAQQARASDAALLLGFVDAWYLRHDDTRQPNELRLATLAAAAAVAALGAQPFAQARSEGTRIGDTQAEALAHSLLPQPQPAATLR